LRVEDLMHAGADLPIVRDDAPLKETLIEITSKRLGVTGVVDGAGELLGIITDGDLRSGLERAADIRTLRAGDLMTRSPKTIEPAAIAGQAVATMERHRITSLFVVAPGTHRPAGVIHLHDLLRAGIV
jgi:arabinose-5-phosphate isomerase